MDPFTTLGIERSYDVDVRTVEKIHRELSRTLHPDRYVGAPSTERREALARAVAVNEAFRVVRDPIRRAEALLSLRGVGVGEGREPSPEPEFLMEMLERREALADAKRARDAAAVRGLADDVRERSASVERALADGLVAAAGEPPIGELGKLRFYRRFLDEVSAIEDGLVG